MKNFKNVMASILAAAALASLAGCSEKNELPKNLGQDIELNNSTPNNAGSLNTNKTNDLSYKPIALTDNNTENSIRLFDSISADKENAMFSPLSLNMALGLIEAGAKGETKAALDSYLRTENFTEFMENYMKLAREKYSSEDKYGEWKNVLEIANSLWADNSLPLKDEYKKTMTERLGAAVENVSFDDKDNTLNKINGWISDKTHEMIPKALNDLDSGTVAVLVNTVYFESPWMDKWYLIGGGKDHYFTLPDGTQKETPMIRGGSDIYFENDKATAFSSGYRNGLEFIGILPKNEGEFDLESLDIPALLASRTDEFAVETEMPRLEFETDFELADPLKAAGLQNIFENADFSGMSDASLFVTDVLQKTKLELNEYGTKASAATSIMMAEGAIIDPRETKSVHLDRPFAFMIYDSEQDQILFLGKVTNP